MARATISKKQSRSNDQEILWQQFGDNLVQFRLRERRTTARFLSQKWGEFNQNQISEGKTCAQLKSLVV